MNEDLDSGYVYRRLFLVALLAVFALIGWCVHTVSAPVNVPKECLSI